MEDEAAPSLPSEADEAAFFADASGRAAATAPAAAETDAPDNLPRLDELVGRIPAGVREALDELFRARFTGVKRASEKDLGLQTS